MRSPLLMSAAAFLALAAPVKAAQAAAPLHAPRSDSEVVEVLRERPLSAEERDWRTLRQQARLSPEDVALASQVARQALMWARRDGDPRMLGQAQAALGHWWTMAEPPAEIRLLRATILQSNHDFDAALKDLYALVRANLRDTQAWLTIASVEQVKGRYTEAAAACAGLNRAGAFWPARVCTLELRSYTGEAADALVKLDALVQTLPRDMAPQVNLIRAELAERLGRADQAARLYALLLAQGGADAYVEGAYADLLLDQGQPAKVVALLKGRERNDALLLRLAEAYAATDNPARHAATQALKARFAAAKVRGDRVHQREEARFAVRLLKQPSTALTLARLNWQVQKEPADARILIEAAQAAQQPEAAQEALRFIASAGWTDKRLETSP
jgi:hypothetical protein